MKPTLAFLIAWGLSGIGAVVGSILGNAAGKRGLFVGAIVGGIVGVALSVQLASTLGWISPSERRGGLMGGIVGFVIAAPIAVANLHTPITPVLICALTGVGLLLGVGVSRGWQCGS